MITLCQFCYTEPIQMNEKLKNAAQYYFTSLIPLYYQGKRDFSDEMNIIHREYNVGMQGNGFSVIKNSNSLLFNFYYLINHDRQDVQGILLASEEYDGNLYEYWIFQMSDRGTPYNYAFFYLTRSSSIISQREVIDVSKKYKEKYILALGKELDLSIKNLTTLYQSEPWDKLESFSGTKYENMIVKWKGGIPFCRRMNFIERLYFRFLKKSKRQF